MFSLLDERHGLGLAVHGSGGGEHDGVAVGLVHGVEQVQGAGHVGLVVPQRLLSGLTHSLQTPQSESRRRGEPA